MRPRPRRREKATMGDMTDFPEALIVDADPNDVQGTRDRAKVVFIAYGTVAIRYKTGDAANEAATEDEGEDDG